MFAFYAAERLLFLQADSIFKAKGDNRDCDILRLSGGKYTQKIEKENFF